MVALEPGVGLGRSGAMSMGAIDRGGGTIEMSVSGAAMRAVAPEFEAVPTVKLRLNYRPRAIFRAFHDTTKRFNIIVAHRRAGKTVAAIQHLIRAAMRHTMPLPRFAYIAPTYRQAKDIAWGYVLQTYNELKDYASINESELRIDFPNGGRVRLYGADNPDSLRGLYFDGVVIDESALADPRLYTEILIPALADRKGWVVFIGTPKGQNWFYQRLQEAVKKPLLWFHTIIRASESGIFTKEELQDLRDSMSEAEYNQEFECSFEEGAVNQFIDGNLVIEAKVRESPATGPVLVGVDVSRFGDDRTPILVRRGRRLLDVKIKYKMPVTQTAAEVVEVINYYAKRETVHTFVDGIGIGSGVVDILKERGFGRIYDVNSGGKPNDKTRFLNKRAEMYWHMREWLKEGDIRSGGDELGVDLTVTRFSYDSHNRIRLEPKDEIKKRGLLSPDLADALALTFAEHVPIDEARVIQGPVGQEYASVDDPLEELYR